MDPGHRWQTAALGIQPAPTFGSSAPCLGLRSTGNWRGGAEFVKAANDCRAGYRTTSVRSIKRDLVA